MGNTSILIVEDEAIVSADIASKLRKLGYAIAGSTGTGEEAIEIARQSAAVAGVDGHPPGRGHGRHRDSGGDPAGVSDAGGFSDGACR